MSHSGPADPNPAQPGPHQPGSYGWNPQGGYSHQPPPQPRYDGGSPYAPIAQPGTLPLRPLTLGDYFAALFATIRNSPGLFFGAALIFGALAAMLTAFGDMFVLRSFGANILDPYAALDQFFSSALLGFLGSAVLSQVVLVVGQTFNWGIYSIMVGRGAIGMKTSLGQGFRLLRGQWGKLTGLLALIFVALVVIYGAMVLFIVLLVSIGISGADAESGAAIGLLILGGLAAIFVPLLLMLYFAIRWHLVIPAIVVEDSSILTALRRSWRLTRGYFWRTLGIALLFGIILGIVSTIITSPLTFIASFVLMSAGTEAELMGSMMVVNLLITALVSLVSFIVTNMGVLISVFFYYDYRFRREGLGLAFQQHAAQRTDDTRPDRFDTSGNAQPATDDELNDLIPGRTTVPPPAPQPGAYEQYGQPGQYRQQPPYPGQSAPPPGPPQPPGPGA